MCLIFIGFPQEVVANHNAVTAVNLKAHPSSRGTVHLTGSHPQDPLNIQKMHFQAENGPQDVADLREAIKRSRTVMQSPLISLFVEEEVFPGPQVQTDEQIDDHIYQNIFGESISSCIPTFHSTDPTSKRTSCMLHQLYWPR